MIDRVTGLTWRGRHWIEWSILTYYVGWVVLGASTPLLSHTHVAYPIASALVGAWGVAAWVGGWRRVECVAIWILAALTVAQGLVLMVWGGIDESLTTGIRLLLAPATMVPIGALRRTEVLLAMVRARRDA